VRLGGSVAGGIFENPSQRASSRGFAVDWWMCFGCISSVGTSIGAAATGVAASVLLMRFEGAVGVSCSTGEPGNVPGISSLSWRDASLAGTVRGARVDWVSWERETLFTGYYTGSVVARV
jgi:hypothetical protein